MPDDETASVAEQQDEAYKKLRAEGKSKLEAANEASPPGTTQLRAEEADEAGGEDLPESGSA